MFLNPTYTFSNGEPYKNTFVAQPRFSGNSNALETSVSRAPFILETVISDLRIRYFMRVLSLHPAATELMFAIGAGSMLVGRTDSCDYPEPALKVPTLGPMDEISPELVGVFEPELVLTGYGQRKLSDELSDEKRVFHIAPGSVEEVFRIIMDLAELLGKQIEAEVVIHELMATLEMVKDKAQKFKKVRVYFEVKHDPLTTAGCYIDDILMLSGGQSFRGEVTVDRLQLFDPQIIMVSVPDEGEEFNEEILLARDGWENLNAVRFERVFVLDDKLFFRPGPRLVKGIRKIAKIMHGIDAKLKSN